MSCCLILLVLTCYVCFRDLMKTRLGMGSREAVQPGLTLGKSSFHPFQRMLPQSQNLWRQAILPILPMEHMHPTVLSTWSILFWLSCKCWVKVQLLCSCPSCFFSPNIISSVVCSTLVIKQKLPGIYVQPSYKSALSKNCEVHICSFYLLPIDSLLNVQFSSINTTPVYVLCLKLNPTSVCN